MTRRGAALAIVAMAVLAGGDAAGADPLGRIVVPSPGPAVRGLPMPPLLGAPVPRAPTIAEDIREDRERRRQLDGSTVRITLPSAAPRASGNGARAGRPDLDRLRAGDFARSGPTAIGASPVTRPATGARRLPNGR